MNDKRLHNSGGVATARKPRLVTVGSFAGRAADSFRTRDWDVCPVSAGSDLVCAIMGRRPSAVVLPVETGWESGYLIAAKLRKVKPRLRIVLVANARKPGDDRFARFVGATLVAEADGIGRLVNTVMG
jgi:hypothetical protein